MHTDFMIINLLKALGENPVFQHQSQGSQDHQGRQAMPAPAVHLVSILFAKPGAWHQIAPRLSWENTVPVLRTNYIHWLPKRAQASLSDDKATDRGLALVL